MWTSSTFKCFNRKAPVKPYTLYKSLKKPKEEATAEATESSDTVQDRTDEIEKEVENIINSCDVINISKNLLVRTVVYNKRWTASRADKLLRWR